MNELKLNEIIFITIKRMGINGEGIGYYKRLAVFVENALVDEEVEVKITNTYDKYATAEIVKIKKISPSRVKPRCPYYEKCGGCQLQHLEYEEQLNQKKNILIYSLERYLDGFNKIRINDTIGMNEPYFYRNKTQLPVRHDGEKVVSGLYAKNTNKLVYIDECIVENKLVQNTLKNVLDVLTKTNVDIYNPRYKQGLLRYVVIRGFEETSEAQVTLVTMELDSKISKALKMIAKIENVKSVNYCINNDIKGIEILNDKIVNTEGVGTVNGKLKDLSFDILPNSFFQLNTKQTIVLYDEIKKAINPKGDEKVLDCYCGIGSIGLFLASSVKEIRGIDNNKGNIENAKNFAEKNSIKNAQFYYGNILPHLNAFSKNDYLPDVVIVDPPRKGLELNFINYLQKNRIKKIVYVSCNTSTLAKNLNHLQKDYIIRYIQPIDMFPQTSNVECVVCLERR
ncbi:MAG: 23S rRNA (uracil(1939)-C(5))-methyltransferase RlmD [Bacilli bacterium]|nr:23S rRNA (uracil(1939)-C(5))-methyltransferase RlmD [Bacilli bacterium]